MQRVSKEQWIVAGLIYGFTAGLFLIFAAIAWFGAFTTGHPGLIYVGAMFLIFAVGTGYAYAYVHVNLKAICSREQIRRA